jgi:hypothetical protein
MLMPINVMSFGRSGSTLLMSALKFLLGSMPVGVLLLRKGSFLIFIVCQLSHSRLTHTTKRIGRINALFGQIQQKIAVNSASLIRLRARSSP